MQPLKKPGKKGFNFIARGRQARKAGFERGQPKGQPSFGKTGLNIKRRIEITDRRALEEIGSAMKITPEKLKTASVFLTYDGNAFMVFGKKNERRRLSKKNARQILKNLQLWNRFLDKRQQG